MDSLILIAALVFIVAGTIKGIGGLGLPTASISLLSQFYDPYSAIALVMFPMLFSNIWQTYKSGEARRTFKTYWPFGLMLIIFILIFVNLSVSIPVEMLTIILGAVIILFSLSSLLIHPPELPERFDKPAQIIAGTIAGIMGGLTAIWSAPLIIYLVSRRLDKDDFIRASGLLITMGTVPLCFGYWANGLLTGSLAGISMLMIIPTIVGFNLGARIRRRIEPAIFQKVVLIIFLLMGLNLIRKALF